MNGITERGTARVDGTTRAWFRNKNRKSLSPTSMPHDGNRKLSRRFYTWMMCRSRGAAEALTYFLSSTSEELVRCSARYVTVSHAL
jgi:hypothetical protein